MVGGWGGMWRSVEREKEREVVILQMVSKRREGTEYEVRVEARGRKERVKGGGGQRGRETLGKESEE